MIDLSASTEKKNCDVAAECNSLGLEYLMAAQNSEDLEADQCVDLVLGWLKQADAGPTLMFDGSGGRCATFLAIYRSVVMQVPLEKALVEARSAGMKPRAPEEFVRVQYHRLTSAE